MTEILNENLLKSDFTFGFELEACASYGGYHEYSNNANEEYDLPTNAPNGVDGELAEAIDTNLNYLLNKNVPEKLHKYGNIDNDPSIEPGYNNDYEEYDYSFEWASPVLKCTPYNFNRVIKMLYNLDSYDIYTNESCGFHHHLSYKGITERDMIWIYVNLCMDTEFRSFMKYVDGVKLTSDEWSPEYILEDIKDSIENNNYERVLKCLSDDKYRLFRIHPYGTIEWRGPRDFLNEGSLTIIKDFYKKFNTYISKVIEYQARKTIFNTNISKEEFFNQLTQAKEKNPDKNRELEFLVRTHGYHDRPLNYKTERGAIISERLIEAMYKNPELLYNLIMEEKKGLIPIFKNKSNDINIILYKLSEMGVVNPEEFTNKLFNLLVNTFSDFSKINYLIRYFEEYLDENAYINALKYSEKNTDFIAIFNIIKSIIKLQIKIPFNELYNNLLLILKNNDWVLVNYWLESILRYAEEVNYNLLQIIKIILLFVKMSYRKSITPDFASDPDDIIKYVSQLNDNELIAWNNRLIAGLFESPQKAWMALLIVDHKSLDIKGLIALCSRYDGIYKKLNNNVKEKIKMYIED